MEKLKPWIEKEEKFRFLIEGIGLKISQQEQIKIVKMFNILPF